MIQEKMVRARRQYHHNYHHQHNGGFTNSSSGQPRGNRHVLNHNHHFHRSNKRPAAHVPSAPSNTTQFIMNDHELIEPDFDLMHNAIMEHYNRRKRRKSQQDQQQQEDDLQQQQKQLHQSDEGSVIESACYASKVKKFTGSKLQSNKNVVDDCKSISPREEDDNFINRESKKIESFENDSPLMRRCCTTSNYGVSPLRTATTTIAQQQPISSILAEKSPLKDVDDEESKNHIQLLQSHKQQQQQQQQGQIHHQHHHFISQKQQKMHHQQQQQQPPQLNQIQQTTKQNNPITTMTNNNNNTNNSNAQHQQQLQESTNISQPTTPNYRPVGSPGDEDGLSPFISYEHLQSEFQEVYANIHTERLSSMSKHQLVDKYLLLEERVEELENQLRESQTAAAASHG